jgi:hypothetical protein
MPAAHENAGFQQMAFAAMMPLEGLVILNPPGQANLAKKEPKLG